MSTELVTLATLPATRYDRDHQVLADKYSLTADLPSRCGKNGFRPGVLCWRGNPRQHRTLIHSDFPGGVRFSDGSKLLSGGRPPLPCCGTLAAIAVISRLVGREGCTTICTLSPFGPRGVIFDGSGLLTCGRPPLPCCGTLAAIAVISRLVGREGCTTICTLAHGYHGLFLQSLTKRCTCESSL